MKYVMAVLMLLFFIVGCAPAISQEQYNALQAELKTSREQLAATKAELESLKSQIASSKDPLVMPRQTWFSLQPYVELSMLIFENWSTLGAQRSKTITDMEADARYTDQSKRFDELMKKFGDTDFVNSQKSVWYITPDNPNWESWDKGYNILRDKLKENMNKLTIQLNP